jgi:hypothetical protein
MHAARVAGPPKFRRRMVKNDEYNRGHLSLNTSQP